MGNSPKSMQKNKTKARKELVFSDSDGDSDYIPDETDEMGILNDSEEYKTFLNSLFPSSYLSSQIKNEKMKKKAIKKNIKKSAKNNKQNKKTKKTKNKSEKKKKVIRDTYKFPTDEEEEEDEFDNMMMNPAKFSIVYTFGDEYENEEYNEEDCDTEVDTEVDTDYEEIYQKNIDDVTEEEWEKAMRKEEEKLSKQENKRKTMLKKLKVKDKVKVKKRNWEKKYIGIITKIYKNRKFYDIKLKNEEFEPLIRVRDNIILEKYNEKEINKIPKDIKQLILLKKSNPNKYDKQIENYEKELKEEYGNINKKKEKKQKTPNVERLKKLLREKN